jgi:hypothetical protein
MPARLNTLPAQNGLKGDEVPARLSSEWRRHALVALFILAA